jgi:hypothetical protein
MYGSQVAPTTEDTARYGREIDNVRAALDWSISPVGDVEIGVALTAVLNQMARSVLPSAASI